MIDLPGSGRAKTTRMPSRGFNRPIIANCRLKTLVFVLVVGMSNAALTFKAGALNAQEWVPRNAVGAENAWPIAQASGPTHLVIQAPTRHKHSRSTHHGVPQIATPKYQESVGGGHWNQSDALPPLVVDQGEVPIGNEFGPGASAGAAPPKKKIDLTHAIPSHTHKTPRSTAIPDAQRTTGWKQPYSYGHFGAKHNRQLSIHHGHQRSYTQWTFR